MEVRLKQTSLLLLLTVAGAVLAGELTIDLNKTKTSSPQSQKVPLGSCLTLRCCLSTKDYQRYWVYWYFQPSGSNESALLFEKMTGNTTQQPWQHLENEFHDKAFSISNVNETHSGWYFCKVRFEIPMLHYDTSNKTEVVVLKLLVENTTFPSLVTSTKAVNYTTSIWWIWIMLGVSSVIVLILIVVLVLCVAQKRKFPGSRVVDPVYENTRKRRSRPPNLEVDTLKAGSCSQNRRTPSPSGRYERQLRYHV